MNQILELIVRLREEVSRLTDDRDKIKEEYDNIERQLKADCDNVEDINSYLEDDKLGAMVIPRVTFTSLILSLFVGTIMFFYSKETGFPYSYVFNEISVCFASTFTTAFVCAIAFQFLRNKITKFLASKNSNIKKEYDKVNSLINEKNFKEQNIIKMEKELKELKVILDGVEDKLEMKKEELEDVEKVYFDSLSNKPSINENVHDMGMAKTRIRKKDDESK